MGSLADLRVAFERDVILLMAWVHYLCFDLFCARWIVNDAPEAGYRLAPVLLLTLFYGPVGLLVYWVFRGRLVTAAA